MGLPAQRATPAMLTAYAAAIAAATAIDSHDDELMGAYSLSSLATP